MMSPGRVIRSSAVLLTVLLLGGAQGRSNPSPDEHAWRGAIARVHDRFTGTPGTFAHFGDSITDSLAFWSPLPHDRRDASPELERDYRLVEDRMRPECWRDWKGPDFGNEGGRSILWAEERVDGWLAALNPEVALIMFGTNDLGQLRPDAYKERLTAVVRRCLDNGTIVILSTIPPRHSFEGEASAFAEAAREVASALAVPLVDYHAEILGRRPDDWDGASDRFRDHDGYDVPTLIARDGVHPSAPVQFQGDYSEEALRSHGYNLRNALVLMAYAEVLRAIAAPGSDEVSDGEGPGRPDRAAPITAAGGGLIRVAAAQPRNRTIDFRLAPEEVLDRVDRSLSELEQLIRKAGEAGCKAVALPEDTLGLLNWEAAHPELLDVVLPTAVGRMLDRLGREAAAQDLSLVVCSDAVEADGRVYNTSFLIGRDGREIGRYHKVNLPMTEQGRARGSGFPVFPTPDLGAVGLLICYDMVFPEAARALALGGADLIVHSTLGGAAIGDGDISEAAFRTRAVENFVYLVVSQRGQGSMIISPRGTILATAEGPDSLAIADIDPLGGRSGGDAMNFQEDFRGRLFRERVPGAYGILTDPEPPVLAKVPSNITTEEAIRIMATVLTTGEQRFNRANELARSGETEAAIRLFEQLCEECPTSWIDRAARARSRALRSPGPAGAPVEP